MLCIGIIATIILLLTIPCLSLVLDFGPTKTVRSVSPPRPPKIPKD